MTNYEWLVKNKPDLVKGCLSFARGFGKKNDEPMPCIDIRDCCTECEFFNDGDCEPAISAWLDEEHFEKPLPCPCCGSEVQVRTDLIGWYFIRCECGIDTQCQESRGKLLEVWNRRV